MNLVQQLEVPVVPPADQVLYAPLIGHVDSRRADALLQRVLAQVQSANAVLLIIDLAGMPLIDAGVVGALSRMARGVHL